MVNLALDHRVPLEVRMPPTPGLRRVTLPAADIAQHHQVVEPGPRPLVRALLGLLLGLAAGVLAALLTPHPDRAARSAEMPGQSG